jgi:hypothetical protein
MSGSLARAETRSDLALRGKARIALGALSERQKEAGMGREARNTDAAAIDPIEELRAICSIAEDAMSSISEGRALNGMSALLKIKNRAADAARWAQKENA